MNLRKRTIAGIAVVAVIFVGAFAEAMFSEGGVGGLARGWGAIESFVRPSPEKRAQRAAEKPRFARWSGPEPSPVHPIGDANAQRPQPEPGHAQGLEDIRAVSREPLDFDPWADGEPDGASQDPAGSIAEIVAQGSMPAARRGDDGGPGGPGLSGAGASGPAQSFHPVAFAAIGGGGGGIGFVDPTASFGGVFASAEAEVVATPLPSGAVLFLPALAALIGRWRRLI